MSHFVRYVTDLMTPGCTGVVPNMGNALIAVWPHVAKQIEEITGKYPATWVTLNACLDLRPTGRIQKILERDRITNRALSMVGIVWQSDVDCFFLCEAWKAARPFVEGRGLPALPVIRGEEVDYPAAGHVVRMIGDKPLNLQSRTLLPGALGFIEGFVGDPVDRFPVVFGADVFRGVDGREMVRGDSDKVVRVVLSQADVIPSGYFVTEPCWDHATEIYRKATGNSRTTWFHTFPVWNWKGGST